MSCVAKKINIEKLFNKIANNSDKPDIAALKYLKKNLWNYSNSTIYIRNYV